MRAGNPHQYNLLYSVNHPGFAIQYGQRVLPLLVECGVAGWPQPYMHISLKAWLSKHARLLDLAGCRDICRQVMRMG